jgi:hypothetical protein
MFEKEAEEYAYTNWTDYPEKQEVAEQAYLASAEPREKRIAEKDIKITELEKENAKLKKEADFFHTEKGNYKTAFLKEVIEKRKINKQLAKAKELLKDITSSYGSTEVSEAQVYLKIKKAEQFLNNEVKK